jgi:LacI family gluconate utilization system Gnt-I transcriptional repressor
MNKPIAPRPATLHDVAEAAGVSLITASRALGNPAIVSEKTRERVRQAVEATGYIPNLLAGGLKSRRSRMVAGVVPALSVSQFLPTVQSLTAVLAQEGYQLLLGQTFYDVQREEEVLNAMIGRQPDGIVMMGLVQSDRARERLRRTGIPVVETWDFIDRPLDMVASAESFQSRLGIEGAVPLLGDGAQYAARIQAESAKWAAVIKASGATA